MDNEEVVMVEQVDKKWDALIEEIERIRKEKFKEGVEYFKLKIQEAIKKGKVTYEFKEENALTPEDLKDSPVCYWKVRFLNEDIKKVTLGLCVHEAIHQLNLLSETRRIRSHAWSKTMKILFYIEDI